MVWSIESDLIDAAGVQSLDAALRKLGICDESCSACVLRVVRDWYRSGAETYGLEVAVEHSARQSERLFVKACVALGSLQGVGKIVDEWVDRRALVAATGVLTPRLFAAHRGTIVEEFVPYELREVLSALDREERSAIVESLISAAQKLADLGFRPVSFHDWRSRGRDVVLVDFGEDLGPARPGNPTDLGLFILQIDELLSPFKEHRPIALKPQ